MTTQFSEKILLVDDEINVLTGLKRQLRNSFNIATAEGGINGLKAIQNEGPFAVIVSDMRMPQMNGIQFLVKASEISPDSVRMMLTGNADVETAMHAVNEGNIFRFLTKPCQKSTMEWALTDGIRQYRLVMAEHDLLENTLKGSVHVLTNIMELVNPIAFSRTSRIKNYVTQICRQLNVKNIWQYELAAMLSQIGCVAIPSDTLLKVYAGSELTEEEMNMYLEHPQFGGQLLSNIPRLEHVSRMVHNQLADTREDQANPDALPTNPGLLGAQIIRTAMDFDSLITRGKTATQALGELKTNSSEYHSEILATLRNINLARIDMQSMVVNIKDLNDAMILGEDIYTTDNVLLAAKDQQVSVSVRKLLRNHVEQRTIAEKVNVFLPKAKMEAPEPANA